LANPILKPLREKDGLATLNTFDETCHAEPLLTCRSLPRQGVSAQPRPIADSRIDTGSRVTRPVLAPAD
ncbi:hypothetical protein, partial [Tabrizicola sp.]|uniref:hypothetical protein n=1 Tax=Tabrizicola sp. TaxID=2005166 RepID=UPI00286B0562